MEQIAIALTGVTATLLTQDTRAEWRRYACLFGMAGQPFWFWTTYTHQQWGIFGLAFVYTFARGRGIWTHWIRKAAA